MDSFADQLLSALGGPASKAGDDSIPETAARTNLSQDSGVRQVPDASANALSNPAASESGSTFPGFVSFGPSVDAPKATSPAPQASVAPVAPTANSGNTAGLPSAHALVNASADTPNSNTSPAATTPMTEVDAYWAAQPPEVQQLRGVADFSERNSLAQHLADEGFTIDKAIMVWGWDPMKTMVTRKMYGYTWAPSLNQGNVSTPGITLIGQTPYDPNSPPPGSIAVNTDFAKGLGITDPWALDHNS